MNNNRLPRGIRNNNPLNIEKNRVRWQGMASEQNDKRFVVFRTMPWGVRAAFKTLQTYRSHHHCLTLRQFINRWAPPVENDTSSYLDNVCKRAVVKPDVILPSPRQNCELWCRIVGAMIQQENGRSVDAKFVNDGWHMAFDYI